MYRNFVYFILVLLIYTVYLPPERPYLNPFDTAVAFFTLVAIFVLLTRASFRVLSRQIDQRGAHGLHSRFDRIFNRLAMMAVVIFALDVYVLNLKLFIKPHPLFSLSPTLVALLFIGLFLFHLVIIWAMAYEPYRRLFQAQVSRRSYVISNVTFNLPIILPWLLISIALDIIDALPFETPKDLLATPEGQVVFFSCFLGALVVVTPALIKSFWKCRPLADTPKRRRIEALCRQAGVGYNNILDWPIFEGRLLTAGVMGLVKRFRYILVTESLLQILDDFELDAVMAHEIGHVKKKHLLLYLVFFLGLILVSYAVFDLILYGIMVTDLALPVTLDPKAEPFPYASILFVVAMAATLFVYFRYIFGYFMRNCERQADLYAFSLLGTSRGLVSSLEKIALHSGKSRDRPNWHHFSIGQRIDYLKKCAADGRWITRHDRKLQASVAVFVVGLLCVGYVGYAMNFGKAGQALNTHLLERIVERELKENPDDPKLYTLLGTIHFQRGAYGAAIVAYESSIQLAPQDPETLNNLAWIYATCEESQYQNAIKALVYAEQAAALNPAPYVLDTLAESYYANGLYDKAVAAITEALAMRPEERAYYEGQLEKFQQAKEGLGY
ncbi:MAG: M48 family metalloprotease [Thermodesulfobacteriota bacterium]|nr:M48 family metalloprotease [Thermodesulfobacteriota bacterium]